MTTTMRLVGTAALVAMLCGVAEVEAQRGRGAAPAPPRPPRESAYFDLTGHWASVVTDDWMERMVTPPKGSYRGVPLNATGRKVADTWSLDADVAAGRQCLAYGIGNFMRVPGRLHITWEGDSALRIELDAGRQTRRLQFAPESGSPEPTLQGHSIATWEKVPQTRGFGRGRSEGPGTLKVVTTAMTAGYLRTNGVPYSDRAVVTEYFDRGEDFGIEWLTVTTIVEDPQYLTRPYLTSSQFRREPDSSAWRPSPCDTPRPPK